MPFYFTGHPRHPRPFPRACLVLLAALTFGACSDATSPDLASIRRRASLSRLRWNAQHLDNYSYVYSRYCFCGIEVVGVRIEVRDGDVVAAFESTDAPVQHPLSLYPTIDDLFDYIDEAARSGPDFMEVEYDAHRAYPTVISVDHDYRVADDENAQSAGNLVPR